MNNQDVGNVICPKYKRLMCLMYPQLTMANKSKQDKFGHVQRCMTEPVTSSLNFRICHSTTGLQCYDKNLLEINARLNNEC